MAALDPDHDLIGGAYGSAAMADQHACAVDAAFQGRAVVAGVAVGLAVMCEPVVTENHAFRAGLAHTVLFNPATYGPALAFALVADGVTGASSTDLALRTRLAVLWDRLAGFPQ